MDILWEVIAWKISGGGIGVGGCRGRGLSFLIWKSRIPYNVQLEIKQALPAMLAFSAVVVAITSFALFFFLPPDHSSYALCSPDGTRDIYTVDGLNSRVQCIAVHKKLIFHTGSLGQCSEDSTKMAYSCPNAI